MTPHYVHAPNVGIGRSKIPNEGENSTMRNLFPVALILAAMVTLSACSTPLTARGFRVNLVTASSSSECNLIGVFTVQGSDPDDTLRLALNEAGALGADSMAVADGKEITSGAEITGAALICRK